MSVDSLKEKPIVISLGGNALKGPGKEGETVPAQRAAAQPACDIIASTLADGNKVAVVHGNGPQFGWILGRSEAAARTFHEVPTDAINADTQGAIGYMISQAIYNCLVADPRLAGNIAALMTQVVIDPEDPAFKDPRKPIGSFMSEAEASARAEIDGWVVREESKGWRRNVASPRPQEVVEINAIRNLVESGFATICGGGGGIPVIKGPNGKLTGVDGVIDKDRTTALIAEKLGARLMAVLTAIPGLISPDEYAKHKEEGGIIDVVTVNQARAMLGDLHKGNMGPKLEACADFVDQTGQEALITDFANARAAIAGEKGVGTRVVYSKGHE